MIYRFLTVAPHVPAFLHNIPSAFLKIKFLWAISQGQSKVVYESSHRQSQEKHRTWEIAAIKAQTCWVATEQTIGKARGDFHLQSCRSDQGEGERGSAPWGSSNKPDTSKSLHMGNVCGRGTSLLLRKVSCQSRRLITMVGRGQFRWQKCLCLHFYCQTWIEFCTWPWPNTCLRSQIKFSPTVLMILFMFLHYELI